MLFVSQTASALNQLLERADRPGPVAVLGHARLARALERPDRQVVLLDSRLRSLRRSRGLRVCAAGERLPFADHCLGALVGIGLGEHQAWEQVLAEWRRVVRGEGMVLFCDRGDAEEMSRRALCGGLSGIAQLPAGRMVVTGGRVDVLTVAG